MYKLIILFDEPLEAGDFQRDWQKFMGLAEKMPRLRREVVSRVQEAVYAPKGASFTRMHELIFDSRDALEAALASPAGMEAGQFLQAFTGGRMILLTAEHMQAEEEDFRKPAPG